jgi:hypothetical protein
MSEGTKEFGPTKRASLQAMEKDLAALAESRVVKTEMDRELVARQRQLVEILLYGEPKTALPSRHHG